MRHKLTTRLNTWRFNSICCGILNTTPLRTKYAPLIFVSMVSHKDLQGYLLAIKSIYRYFMEGRIIVINDGTLTNNDLELIRIHVDNPNIIHVATIDTGPCPQGGCWERLTLITKLTQSDYVIQVDSDLLAIESISEVVEAYQRNIAFTQSGSLDSTLCNLEQASLYAETQPGQHMQTISERVLQAIKPPFGQRYTRGSAGFAGFPRGLNRHFLLQTFSEQMVKLVGLEIWSKWGSEQVSANYIIANCPEVILLDAKRYSIHWKGREKEAASLIHFVGMFRYSFGTYIRYGERVILELV